MLCDITTSLLAVSDNNAETEVPIKDGSSRISHISLGATYRHCVVETLMIEIRMIREGKCIMNSRALDYNLSSVRPDKGEAGTSGLILSSFADVVGAQVSHGLRLFVQYSLRNA